MKIERTKNAARNIFFGGMQKIYQIIVSFLMRTAMIYFMGVQYLGLNSLFTSILQVLNLAELGVGSTMVYSMYKPIVDDDEVTICALLKLYEKYYNIIGLVIALIGISLTPFMPKLINGDVPADINVYILYLLNLTATVLSYWMCAYKNSILQAHQRSDVVSKVTLITNTIQYILQIVAIGTLKNYYLFVIITLAMQAITNITIAIIATKMYPNYKSTGELTDEVIRGINCRIRDLFTSKIGAIIVNSADTIVISAFLGLTVLAVYQNYYFILTAIIGLVSIAYQAVTAGIGNSLITETNEKNFNDLIKFTFLISWIAGICSCCFLNLYQPFMEIWMGKDLMLGFSAVICFVIYYFVYEINQLLNTYKDAGGIWHQDRFRPLVTAFANLGLNIIMVQLWGIYGVILSTVLSMLFVGMPWILYNLFTTLFEKRQLPEYLHRLIYYAIIIAVSCVITYFTCRFINTGKWLTLIIRFIICLIIPNIFFTFVYCRLPEFKESLLLVDKMTKGKIRLSKLVKR